jgi:hypothetical protein
MFKLTPKQQEIIDSPARTKLVMGGYRSGKTVLAIMNLWKEMKHRKNPRFRAIYLVNSDSLMAYTFREMEHLLPRTSFINKVNSPYGYIELSTTFGTIYIAKKILPYRFDNITIDNASSNSYVSKELLDFKESVFVAGHLPEDTGNTFFRLWLYAYFAQFQDVAAFRLGTYENLGMDESKDKYDKRIKTKFGEARYNRNYLCIPDYLDYISEGRMPEAQWKREYLGEFFDAVDNNKISFDFKGYKIAGFDKAKE